MSVKVGSGRIEAAGAPATNMKSKFYRTYEESAFCNDALKQINQSVLRSVSFLPSSSAGLPAVAFVEVWLLAT